VLRVREVATRLKVHPATVYRWINEGHMQAFRYGKPLEVGAESIGSGGAIRVPEAALAAYETPTTEVA
jgi:excisionase family DNA binding protein